MRQRPPQNQSLLSVDYVPNRRVEDIEDCDSDDSLDIIAAPWQDMPEDAYGAGTTAIIKDCFFLFEDQDKPCLRIARVTFSVGLVVFLQVLQVFLIFRMKQLVTGRAVHSAQADYEDYKSRVYVNGTFTPERWDNFDSEEKGTLCAIPLTHPYFFGSILFIWAFSVASHLRQCFHYTLVFLKNTPTVSFVVDMLGRGKTEEDGDKLQLVGLTCFMKILLVVLMIIPRAIVALLLLFLGSRWLNATFDWAELLLNAVALEFILTLKDAVFNVTVAQRLRIDMQNLQTRLFPEDRVQLSPWNSFRGFLFFLLALGWVVFYLNCQTVLPGFVWSEERQQLSGLCEQYLKESAATLW